VSFSPEVEVVGSRSLSQKVGSMVKKAEVIYNSNHKSLKSPVQTPSISRVHVCPSNSSIEPQYGAMLSDFKVRNSSTGGKVPIHGPRRPVAPSRYLSDDYDLAAIIVRSVIMSSSFIFYAPFFYISLDSLSL
jgi:hypothetical protein